MSIKASDVLRSEKIKGRVYKPQATQKLSAHPPKHNVQSCCEHSESQILKQNFHFTTSNLQELDLKVETRIRASTCKFLWDKRMEVWNLLLKDLVLPSILFDSWSSAFQSILLLVQQAVVNSKKLPVP